MVCVQSEATAPIVRAFEAGEADITPAEPGWTVATGLNVARNVGHINVLRIIRETGGCAVAVTDAEIRQAIRDRVARSPVRLVARGGRHPRRASRSWPTSAMIRPGDRVVLVNTASPEKYLPTIRDLFDGGL